MHVCVAQGPAGRIDWSNSMRKSVSHQTDLSGTIWADDLHFRKVALTRDHVLSPGNPDRGKLS